MGVRKNLRTNSYSMTKSVYLAQRKISRGPVSKSLKFAFAKRKQTRCLFEYSSR